MSHVKNPTPSARILSNRFRVSRILLFASVFMLAACDMRYRAFEPLNPAPLEGQLELDKAKRADVRAALGEPNGSGRSMLPLDTKPRTLWSYYFEEGTLESAERTMILVYFDKDVLAGYLWFASVPQKTAAP